MTKEYEDALNAVTALVDCLLLPKNRVRAFARPKMHNEDILWKVDHVRVERSIRKPFMESIPTIRSALKLAQEAEQLRKERDEFARAIIKIHEDQDGDYDFLKFISHPQYILAKKVVGE